MEAAAAAAAAAASIPSIGPVRMMRSRFEIPLCAVFAARSRWQSVSAAACGATLVARLPGIQPAGPVFRRDETYERPLTALHTPVQWLDYGCDQQNVQLGDSLCSRFAASETVK